MKRGGVRSYRLDRPVDRVLDALEAAGVPVLRIEESKRVRLRSVYAVVDEQGCVLHAPWRSLGLDARTHELGGGSSDLFEIGPALRLRAVPDGERTRLEVEVAAYAPTSAQRHSLGLWVGGAGLLVAAGAVASGGAAIVVAGIAAVVGGSAVAPFVSLLAGQRRRRQQEINELLALVERVYGPLELPAIDGSPERHPA